MAAVTSVVTITRAKSSVVSQAMAASEVRSMRRIRNGIVMSCRMGDRVKVAVVWNQVDVRRGVRDVDLGLRGRRKYEHHGCSD